MNGTNDRFFEALREGGLIATPEAMQADIDRCLPSTDSKVGSSVQVFCNVSEAHTFYCKVLGMAMQSCMQYDQLRCFESAKFTPTAMDNIYNSVKALICKLANVVDGNPAPLVHYKRDLVSLLVSLAMLREHLSKLDTKYWPK